MVELRYVIAHTKLQLPRLADPMLVLVGEYKRRDEGDVHGRCISDKEGVPSSAGLCLGYVCRRVFGWLGLFAVSVELRHSTGGG
jgi:hypothetical protein